MTEKCKYGVTDEPSQHGVGRPTRPIRDSRRHSRDARYQCYTSNWSVWVYLLGVSQNNAALHCTRIRAAPAFVQRNGQIGRGSTFGRPVFALETPPKHVGRIRDRSCRPQTPQGLRLGLGVGFGFVWATVRAWVGVCLGLGLRASLKLTQLT